MFFFQLLHIILYYYNKVQYALRTHKTFRVNSRLLILWSPFKIYSAEMGGTEYIHTLRRSHFIFTRIIYIFYLHTDRRLISKWAMVMRAAPGDKFTEHWLLFIHLVSAWMGEDDIKYWSSRAPENVNTHLWFSTPISSLYLRRLWLIKYDILPNNIITIWYRVKHKYLHYIYCIKYKVYDLPM